MKVILRFINMNDRTKTSTFFLNLNDVNEQAVENARLEYRENADKLYAYDDEEAYVNDIKWQEQRVERLGYVQAAMKSAQTRQVWLFSGYEYPECLVPQYGIPGNPLVDWSCSMAVWDWKSLVADDYLKDINEPGHLLKNVAEPEVVPVVEDEPADDSTRNPLIDVTQGMSGYFAIMRIEVYDAASKSWYWDIQESGTGRYPDREGAVKEAIEWAKDMGMKLVPGLEQSKA